MTHFTVDHQDRYIAVRDARHPEARRPGDRDQADLGTVHDPDIVAYWYGKQGKNQLGYWDWGVNPDKVQMAHRTCQLLNDAHGSLDCITAGHDRMCNVATGAQQERDAALKQVKYLTRTSSCAADIEEHQKLTTEVAAQRQRNQELTREVLDLEDKLETTQQELDDERQQRDQEELQEQKCPHEVWVTAEPARSGGPPRVYLQKPNMGLNNSRVLRRAVLRGTPYSQQDTQALEQEVTRLNDWVAGFEANQDKELAAKLDQHAAEVQRIQAPLVSSQRNHDAILDELKSWQRKYDELAAELEKETQRYRYGIVRCIEATSSVPTREQLQRLLEQAHTPLDKTMASGSTAVECGLEQARRREFVPGPDVEKAQELADKCQDDQRDDQDEIKWARKKTGLPTRVAGWDGFDLEVWPTMSSRWGWSVLDEDLVSPLIAEGKADSMVLACEAAKLAAKDANDTWGDEWDEEDQQPVACAKSSESSKYRKTLTAQRAKPDSAAPLDVAAACAELAERHEAEGEYTEATTELLASMLALLRWAHEQ